MPQRVFDVWMAYYQCEPFGSHWEQTASLCSTISSNTSMLAASRGSKLKSFGVVDFMPADSVGWRRKPGKKAKKRSGITHPKLQELAIKRAFGF